jgi:hypothetical protein
MSNIAENSNTNGKNVLSKDTAGNTETPKTFYDKVKAMLGKIRKPYYYVPPCPVCGSAVTGRLVSDHRYNEIQWMINDALKNGELIRPVPKIGAQNCFCLSCGSEWYTETRLMMFSRDQIEEQKKIRHTDEILRQRADEIRENDGGKGKGVLGLFTNFMGKF